MTDHDELKRKLRQLKKVELKIRFGTEAAPYPKKVQLVWDSFFDLKNKGSGVYSLNKLSQMDKEDLAAVIEEFYYRIYYQLYRENGLGYTVQRLYDPDLLMKLGLKPDADYEAVKKRFRQLALKYHPDTGGNAEEFISLMESYKKLTEQ